MKKRLLQNQCSFLDYDSIMSPACSCCNFIYSLSFTQRERERERKSSFYSFTKGLLSLPISRVTYTYTGGTAQLLAHCCAEVVPRGTRLGVTSAAGEMQGVQHLGKVKETSFSSKIKEKAEIGSWPCCILLLQVQQLIAKVEVAV